MIKEILTYDIESNDNPPRYNKQKRKLFLPYQPQFIKKKMPSGTFDLIDRNDMHDLLDI